MTTTDLRGAIVALAVAGAPLLGQLEAWWWPLGLLAHFQVHYLLIGVMAVLALSGVRRLRAATIVGGATVVPLAFVGTLFLPAPASRLASGPPVRLRLLHANVHTTNDHHEALLRLVDDLDPDVIVLAEVDDRWARSLAPLRARYPHAIARLRDDNFGIAAFSRRPLASRGVIRPGPSGLPTLDLRLTERDRSLRLVVTHPLPPVSSRTAHSRNAQFAALGPVLEGPGPRLLVGDLNVTPWSPRFRRLLVDGGLRASTLGWGVQATWPSGFGVLGIPIDHCLVSPDVRVVARRVGPSIGSDHLPLIVDLEI